MVDLMRSNRLKRALPWVVFCTLLGAFGCSGANNSDLLPTEDTQLPGTRALDADGWQSMNMLANYATTKLDMLGHFETSRNACGQSAYGNLDLATWNDFASLMNRAIHSEAVTEQNMVCFDRPDNNRMDGTVDVILLPPNPATPGSTAAYMTVSMELDRPHSSPTPEPVHSSDPSPFPFPFPSSFPFPFPTAHPSPTAVPTHSGVPQPSPSPSASAAPKRALFESRGGQICTTIKDQQLAQSLIQTIGKVVELADKAECQNGWGH
jgi:hypothetical protein